MKFLSVNKKQLPVLMTLLVIISFGFIYLFIYIPRNEKIIREQRFSVLQNIDKNVHEKINNSVILLKNLLIAYEQSSLLKENSKFTTVVIDDYIKKSPPVNFSFIPRKIYRTDSLKKANAIARIDSLDDVYTLKIDNKTQQIFLVYSKKYSGPEAGISAHELGMKFRFRPVY